MKFVAVAMVPLPWLFMLSSSLLGYSCAGFVLTLPTALLRRRARGVGACVAIENDCMGRRGRTVSPRRSQGDTASTATLVVYARGGGKGRSPEDVGEGKLRTGRNDAALEGSSGGGETARSARQAESLIGENTDQAANGGEAPGLPPGKAWLLEYRAPARGPAGGGARFASLGSDLSKFAIFLDAAVARGELEPPPMAKRNEGVYGEGGASADSVAIAEGVAGAGDIPGGRSGRVTCAERSAGACESLGDAGGLSVGYGGETARERLSSSHSSSLFEPSRARVGGRKGGEANEAAEEEGGGGERGEEGKGDGGGAKLTDLAKPPAAKPDRQLTKPTRSPAVEAAAAEMAAAAAASVAAAGGRWAGQIEVSAVEVADEGVQQDLQALWEEGKLLSQERDATEVLRGREQNFSELLSSYTTRTKSNHWEEIPQGQLLEVMEQRYHPEVTSQCGFDPDRPAEEVLSSLKAMLQWFRKDFPYYYDRCHSCDNGDDNTFLGYISPTGEERASQAGRTEMYHCSSCGAVSRFARYAAVSKVLETRRGRCGEYSVLMLRLLEALGFVCRWVVDWSDHVWVEAKVAGRWVHVDPCEAAVDEPLLYESWGKKQTYILAFTKQEVVDVTENYTRQVTQQRFRHEKEKQYKILPQL
eukprot:jgi/Undpi1/1588/HiC_scaffold_11.g04978.m1